MPQILFSLKPLDAYFFAGETNFGIGGNQSYFVRSRLLPQQTSLLGMLRYQILKSRNLLVRAGERIGEDKRADMKSWIGEKSFDPRKGDEKQAFGNIQQLSGIWIQHIDSGNILGPAPFDHDMVYRPKAEAKTSRNMWAEDQKKGAPRLVFKSDPNKYYAGKASIELNWVDKDGEHYKTEDLFIKEGRTGVTKYSHTDGSQGFFRMIRYRLKDKYQFAFSATMKESAASLFIENKRPLVVHIGGERVPFVLKGQKIDDVIPWKNHYPYRPQEDKPYRLLLTSDTYVVLDELYELSKLVLGGAAINFRTHRSNEHTSRYNNLRHRFQKDKKQLTRSNRFFLLSRGTVIYIKDEERLKSIIPLLEAAQGFHGIGYNRYAILSGASPQVPIK